MREVIMPALGMAQSTGVIVSWLKKVGEAVAADDPLMEVETDKTTMEVPAGHDGVVLEIRAEAGAEVPVGEVIALIGAAGSVPPPKPAAAAAPAAAKPEPAAVAAPPPAARPPAPAPAPPPARPDGAAAAAPAAAGKVLASPKARLLAAERGIDLAPHAARSHERPILAADVEAMAAEAAAAPATAAVQGLAATPRLASLRAAAPAAGWAEFLAFASGEAKRPVEGMAVIAAFAAAAFRAATGETGRIVVAAESLSDDGGALVLADPDRAGLASIADTTTDAPATLSVLDLTGTALSGADGLGAGTGPVLVVAGSGERLDLSLSFDPSSLAPRAAAALLTGIARRVENPLRHLL